jgi:endonuclease/exonuclease/phosphatase (EEP) superfamily protein YafD
MEPANVMRSRRATVGRIAADLAAAFVVVVVGLQVMLVIARPEGGPFGLLGVFAQLLAIVGLAAAPFALIRGAWRVRFALVVLVAVVAFRFGGDWVSLPGATATTTAPTISIATWNLEIGSRTPEATLTGLRGLTADVIVVQELRLDAAAAIEADPILAARYPHRRLEPAKGVSGMGILSSVPIRSLRERREPLVQDALLDASFGPLRLINVHPYAPRYGAAEGLADSIYDPAIRNEDLLRIRTLVDRHVAVGELVVLAGDTNTSPSEPAFARLMSGLHDVHAEVGGGPGWSWRPGRLEGLGIGLLRIDVVATGPGLSPRTSTVVCPPSGDHCAVIAELMVIGR